MIHGEQAEARESLRPTQPVNTTQREIGQNLWVAKMISQDAKVTTTVRDGYENKEGT